MQVPILESRNTIVDGGGVTFAIASSQPPCRFGPVSGALRLGRYWSVTAGIRATPVDRQHIKRGVDVVFSFLLLAGLSWLLLLLAMLTRVSGGPALYIHRRVGRHGREFNCFKFRTMRPDAESALPELLAGDPGAAAEWQRDFKLRRDPRVTTLGRWLRRTSLDELPQLWNVLRGDMSLIGPRPVVAAELARYGRYSCYYLQGRPGMTGLWQVSGRGDTGYVRRVALDVLYARTWSLRSDLGILIATVRAVFSRRGAY